MAKLNRYKCHKVVEAAKITQVTEWKNETGCGYWLVFGEIEGDDKFESVPPYWHDKNAPEVGGYFVRYEDGYTSYSPAKAFEDGYALIEGGK